MNESSNEWWGDVTIEVDSTALWQIGPLKIAVRRLPHEWLIAYDYAGEADDEMTWSYESSDLDPSSGEFSQLFRYVFQSTTEHLTILPALADRSVVSRPNTPFTVAAAETANLYISTPLWFKVATGSPPQALLEVAVRRPSDTWFGPSTLEGETCYAIRTHGRLNLENLTVSPNRAVTEIHIHNGTTAPLPVERLNLPVPYLSLYQMPDGLLRTETVTVVQERGASLAEFNIEQELPLEAAGARLIAGPREEAHKGMLIRAFSALTLQAFD